MVGIFTPAIRAKALFSMCAAQRPKLCGGTIRPASSGDWPLAGFLATEDQQPTAPKNPRFRQELVSLADRARAVNRPGLPGNRGLVRASRLRCSCQPSICVYNYLAA